MCKRCHIQLFTSHFNSDRCITRRQGLRQCFSLSSSLFVVSSHPITTLRRLHRSRLFSSRAYSLFFSSSHLPDDGLNLIRNILLALRRRLRLPLHHPHVRLHVEHPPLQNLLSKNTQEYWEILGGKLEK